MGDRMLSKIAFGIFLFLHIASGQNPLSMVGEGVNPIESLFGSGYICLHISDPQFESSPSFQALAQILAKKYNKTTIVHKIGSNETDFPHPQGPDTIHFPVEPTTTVRPPIANLIKQKALKCTKDGYFPNPNNCTKFFRCVESKVKGKPWQIVEFDCGPGTIFDEKISNCNHPAAVIPKPACWVEDSEEQRLGHRGQRTTTTPAPDLEEVFSKPEDPIPQRPDETQQPESQTPQMPDHVDPDNLPPGEPTDEGTIEREPQIPEENLCETPGVFGDKNNCSHYYQCIRDDKGKFNMIWRTCSNPQIFDVEEEECRRPEEVDPKPECWYKVGHIKQVTTIVDQVTEVTDGEPAPPVESVESVEHFDEFESSGTTQMVVTPGKKRITTTIVNTTEEIEGEPGTKNPSTTIKGQKTRITIPKPVGPKPSPQCVEEGDFPHPAACDQYIKCVKKGRTLKLYTFPCVPAGTVFDQVSKKCMQPELIEPIPPIPKCAEWDDNFRPIFEDILNEEVDEEEVDIPPVKSDEEYEEVWVDDGKGGKKLIRRKKVTVTEITEIVETPGGKEPSKDLGGKKWADRTKEKGFHHQPTRAPAHSVQIVNKTTITEIDEEIDSPLPYPAYSPPAEKEEMTTRPPPVEQEPEPQQQLVTFPPPPRSGMPCEDEVALIERLRRENTECEKRVAELEKQNSKMDGQIKRMQKDLGIAKKDKQKYENYIASMDKTIDSYKEDVAWYLQHCPQPTEFIEDEENAAKTRRRRRSIDLRTTPVESVGRTRKAFEEREVQIGPEDLDYPRPPRNFKPHPVHTASEGVDSYDDSFVTTPFLSYDDTEVENSQSHHDHKHNHNHPHNNHERSSTPGDHPGRVGHGHGHSHWSPESLQDGKFLLAEIPLLIFGTLTILLITITLLGCLVVRRLNRMTTFSVTPEDFEASSFRRKFTSGGSTHEKLGQV